MRVDGLGMRCGTENDMTTERRNPWGPIGLIALGALTVFAYIRTRQKPTAEPNTLLTDRKSVV